MRVAVVTSYYRESDDVLRGCLDSVREQTHECRHIVVADGFPNPLLDRYACTHIRLPAAHGDAGNLGRCIGACAAIAEGFDMIAFLDADNWYRPEHIARMVALQARTGASVCTSGRSVHRLDGTLLYPRDGENDGETFVDTNCLCVFRPAFDVLALWGIMPREAGPMGDRIIWEAVKARGIARAHDPLPTVGYRTSSAVHYEHAGETPPAGAKRDATQNAIEWYKALPHTRRRGMELGLGGVDDLAALAAVRAAPETRSTTINSNGLSLTVELPDDADIRFALNAIFNQQRYRPAPGLPSPRAVLDIGANVGLAAAYFRLVYPNAALLCVEPEPIAAALLARNAALIGECHAFPVGLYHGTQVRPFGSGRLLLLDAESFVATLRRQDFDVIKIDTDGAEIPIILSLRERLARTDTIQLGFHRSADRRLMEHLLTETHVLWRATMASPRHGTLCFVRRPLMR